MWYNLKFRDFVYNPIIFKDWEKKTVDFLDEHKNIKKVWLVNNVRKTGGTTFAKLLLYFRPQCNGSFFISNNLDWSKAICKQKPIEFEQYKEVNKDGEWHRISNFLTPVTLFGLEKEIKETKECKDFLNSFGNSDSDSKHLEKLHLECIYDQEFKVETYKTLCSYDFDFFIVNVSSKDLEKARPFIEADKDKEDVLIVEINETLYPEWLEEHNKMLENIKKG